MMASAQDPAGPVEGWKYDSRGRLVRSRPPEPSPLPGEPMPWAQMWITLGLLGVAMVVDNDSSLFCVGASFATSHLSRVRHRWWAAACGLAVVVVFEGLVPGTAFGRYGLDAEALSALVVYAAVTHLPRRLRTSPQ